jgi:hypothetical protein
LLLAIVLLVSSAAFDAGRVAGPDAGSDAGAAAGLDAGVPGFFPVGSDAGRGDWVVDSSSMDGGIRDTSAAEVAPRVTVTIVGAQVQPPAVYLESLKIALNARPDEATGEEVRRQLQEFLQRTGYELATVTTHLVPGGVVAEIDEGKIERIIFLGQLSFQQLRFKLALALPYDVFNRDLLDRQIHHLSSELNTPGVRWELVRTSFVEHEGPQVTRLPSELDLSLGGGEMVHEARPYEVRISFPPASGSFVGLDIRAYYIDGFELGISYVGRDLLMKDDLWYVAASGGLGLRQRLGTGDYYPYFSRGAIEARYSTAKLFKYFKPNIWTQSSVVSRQRPDLALENYWAFTEDAAIGVELEVRPGLRYGLSGGYEYRVLFEHQAPPGVENAFVGTISERQRPFLRLTQESVFNPGVLRWDRRHTIESELRYFFPFENNPGFGWATLRYQYVKEFGWHDFWIKGRGHVSWGEVAFHDEISVGEFVRGIYTGEWVPSGMSLLLEFRFSLVRDVIKVGVFSDFGLLAVPLRTQDKLVAELAAGFGPSFHFLVLDMFQIDIFIGFGVRRGARLNAGFGLILNKAF